MNGKKIKHISDVVGEWGPWQRNITLFTLSSNLFSAFNNLALSFYAPNISYWCSDNTNVSSQSIDACLQGCSNWTYDHSVFDSTIIEEWDLVCDRSNLASLTHSIYMIGYAFAAVFVGHLSDRFGRLPLLWISTIIEILAGISSAFSLSIIHFTISRFLLAFGSNGRLLSAFMLVSECIGPKCRPIVGMCIQFGWAIGYCILPGIVNLLPNFRHFLLATTLPEILWLIWLLTIPESPKWQIANKQFDKAQKELTKAMEKNNINLDEIDEKFENFRQNIESEKRDLENGKKVTLLNVMKHPKLRRSTLIMYFTWFINAFVYYGISLNIQDFGGNLFISFLIAGLIEFPSYIFCSFAFRYFGRRPLTAAMMYGSGLACLGIIPFASDSYEVIRISIAMIGKFCITCSYGLIYVYAAEIYPTVLRQTGVGSCSIAARLGSIMAPFVKNLNEHTHLAVVLSIYGGFSIANGISINFLPETRGTQIPDTIDEAENL